MTNHKRYDIIQAQSRKEFKKMNNTNKTKKITQKDVVLRHMRDFGSIASIEAFSDYGITRLAAVIYNLRKDNVNISSEMCPTVNRYGDTVQFAKYRIVG